MEGVEGETEDDRQTERETELERVEGNGRE